MSYLKLLAVLLIFFISYSYENKVEKPRTNVKLDKLRFGQCKGPKSKECGGFIMNLSASSQYLHAQYIVEEDAPAMPLTLIFESKGQVVMKTTYATICTQPVIKKFLESMVPMKKGCVIPKGEYEGTFNMFEWPSDSIYFFDAMSVKMIMYNKTCNLFCKTMHAVIKKV